MFDTSKIGQNLASFTYEVQRNKIHELTTAIGDMNPIYHSREAAQEAGYPDVPISPTTPTMFSFWGNRQRGASLAEVGINVARVLHGEEEYEYLAPIYPNDVLTGTTTLLDGKTRQGSDGHSMDILTLETSYVNQQQQTVLKARTTIVVRE
ncbi:MAG TPA: MaoC family dehydratase N-terminal domain-containing protein [Ktedonobacteraceae bacterium]|jgi:acyl dehydratase|nr:MaoC family dehydratase N-terminal domain-containing protein [Ktedonobacteraceae bacterium]